LHRIDKDGLDGLIMLAHGIIVPLSDTIGNSIFAL
jgi:hypothetical protein